MSYKKSRTARIREIGYIVGYTLGIVTTVCAIITVIALTCKLFLWLF